jgi:hypothetical protein
LAASREPGFAVILLFRTLAATLALGSMLLRAVLPVGWMPGPTGPTGAALVICSIDGFHHRAPSHEPLGHRAPADHGVACPFAAAAQLAPPLTPVVVPHPLIAAGTAIRLAFEFVFPSAHASEHAPRGPPIPHEPS